jgi:hypothetical protein
MPSGLVVSIPTMKRYGLGYVILQPLVQEMAVYPDLTVEPSDILMTTMRED